MNRYHLNTVERCIVDGSNGQIMRPSCIEDVMSFHAYLIGSGEKEQAQQLLEDIFNGEKVISNMIETMESCGLLFGER